MPIIREAEGLKPVGPTRAPAGRVDEVRTLTERIACLLGIGNVSVRVSDDARLGSKLTSGGIELMVNHVSNEEVARRIDASTRLPREQINLGLAERRRVGVKGAISLHEVDVIAACFASMRARDFLDPSFGRVPFGTTALGAPSQRYLEATIDDMAAEARMLRIPYVKARYDAYISRQEVHFMQGLPLQQQLMKTIRLLLFEDRPTIMSKPTIVRHLGTADHVNPIVHELGDVLCDEALDYRKRQIAARGIIEELFTKMAKLDEAGFSYYEMSHLFDQEESYAPSKNAADDELFELEEFESALRAEKKLEAVNEKNIDQLIADTGEAAMPNDPMPSLHLPGMGDEAGALALDRALAQDYDAVVSDGSDVIESLADLLIRIAQPTESLAIPRYDPRSSMKGARLNPRACVNAHIQLETGRDLNVWQRVRRRIREQSRVFNGLDVLLLVDVSCSMIGERAHFAAVTATYLVEGLQLAYERCRASYDGGTVDIRNQLLAFGESWAKLTPLATVHGDTDKRGAFRAIELPSSNQTIVGGCLNHVRACALESPDREVLCLVVSDGLFADNLRARKQAMGMPANVYLGHVNIGQFGGVPLSEHYEVIVDPSKLPERLTAILEQRLMG